MVNALTKKQISINLCVYGISHALVDAVCAGIVFSIVKADLVESSRFALYVILYNIIAFGFQFLFGFLVDYFRLPQKAVSLGFLFLALALSAYLFFPFLAIVLAGIGNALFHVGAGSICLNLTPSKSVAPGIFVAGALGLFVGIFLGKSGGFHIWRFATLLVILFLAASFIKKPIVDYHVKAVDKSDVKIFNLVALFILLTVSIRSLIGIVLVFPWKTDFNLLIILTVAVVLGKGLGGFLADTFGWARVAVGALLLSAPLLVFCANIPYLAILGMFLFNITMPVTLVALSNILPGRPGFAFGLACLAIFVGFAAGYMGPKFIAEDKLTLFLILVSSIVSLFLGLKYMYKFVSSAKIK